MENEEDEIKGGWNVWRCDDGTTQIIPAFGREHIRSKDCWCDPHWDFDTPKLLIHEYDKWRVYGE